MYECLLGLYPVRLHKQCKTEGMILIHLAEYKAAGIVFCFLFFQSGARLTFWTIMTKQFSCLRLKGIHPVFIWRRQWQPTPVLLPGKSCGRRSLVGCSPWGRKELNTTERLHFHFSLSCVGEGNGNPLQCSCLENPRDGGAWWAAVYGVAQSRTRLKRLSSSSQSL